MPRDVYLVLVVYGQSREREAADVLTTTFERVCPGANVRGVVVDNALDPAVVAQPFKAAITSEITRIPGDNTLHEFSGWDRGLTWLAERGAIADDAIIVLANDTVARADKRGRVLDLTAERVERAAAGAIVGVVDEYPRPVTMFGLTMRQFVDTSFVLAERRTLARLTPLARIAADDEIFGDGPEHFFREPSPLSDNYRRYLRRYFFGDRVDPEFEHDWYAQEPLTDRNADRFKAKLRCVFCEHLFSARARALRIPLVDIRPVPLPIDPFEMTRATP